MQCPYCKEKINEGAKKCKVCRESLGHRGTLKRINGFITGLLSIIVSNCRGLCPFLIGHMQYASTRFFFSLSLSESTINKGDWWSFANLALFACFARKMGGSVGNI